MHAPAAPLNAPVAALARSNPPQTTWPAPLTAEEWDRRFPGILDSVALLAGPANSIMQLARLPVGYGVMESRVDSGNIFKRPAKRTRTTLTYLAVAMLGTTEEKLAYRRAANTSHAQVRSAEGAPVQYNAFDPELQLWVAACLYYGFTDMNARLYGPMSEAQAAEFYRLAEPLGTTLQVRPGMWPRDLAAFNAYWEAGVAQLAVDAPLREHLVALAEVRFLSPAAQRVAGPVVRFLTTGFLPPRVREVLQLDWSPAQQKRFDRLLAAIAFVNRRLPRRVRQHTYLRMMRDLRARMAKGLPLV